MFETSKMIKGNYYYVLAKTEFCPTLIIMVNINKKVEGDQS